MKTCLWPVFLIFILCLSAVELPIPERLELSGNWKSSLYTAANGDEFELSFRLAGTGKLHGYLECNSNSKRDWPRFTAQPGENKFKLSLPEKGYPITYARLHLEPEPEGDWVCENLRLSTETGIRRGDFSETSLARSAYPCWSVDKSQIFKVENGQVSATLSGEKFVYIKQWVFLDPGKLYTVSVDVSAQEFTGFAGFSLSFRGGGKGLDKTLEFMPVINDTDGVKRLIYCFKTPSELHYCALRLAAKNAYGKLTFDNVELLERVPELNIPGSVDFSSKLILNGFFKVNKNKGWAREFAPDLTTIELTTDNRELHLLGKCREDQADKIQAGIYPRDDGKIYSDDNVELFIDAQGIGRSYYQVIVNPKGCIIDFCGKDPLWNGAKATAKTTSDGWQFEIRIPYEEMGYGNMEATLPNKNIALAFFRNRRTTGEAYSLPYWNQFGYNHPEAYMQMKAGTQSKDEYVDFRYVGFEKNAVASPPQAWHTPDPLFRELMGEEKLHPEDEVSGYFSSGFIEYGNASKRPVSIFALHHGLSFNYVRDIVLPHRESRTAIGMTHYAPTGADSKGQIFAARMNAKYNNILMFDTNLKRSDGIFSVKNDAPQYKKSLYFWGDSRTWEQKRRQIDAVLAHWSDNIRLIRLGHEDDSQPGLYYAQIRQSYLEQDIELWQQWEDEARHEFGHDIIGFPSGSLKDATPFERIVWLRWASKKYVSGIEMLIAFLRENHPAIKISSCVGGPFPYPFGYDSLFEKFDYSTTQTRWGGGPNRQEAGFFSKFLTDLSGAPATPCVHIEAYFVSMVPEDVREVLSSVFRGGGAGLQMALFDWFGNSQSDFFGAPERYAEVMHILRQIATMKKLRQPIPDTAIFYSNINQMATHYFSTNPDRSGLEELFTMLGPHARSAFQFVSDRLILDGKRKLDNYRVVYVPNVYYQDEETVTLLLDYVKNGGRLVAFSPDVFKYRTDGSIRPALLPGNLGKGEICIISDFVLDDKLYTNRKAPPFFADMQQKYGCQTGCDIWRFTFPPAPKQDFWPAGLQCLTGNACRWRRNIPFDGPNAQLPFQVTYSNPPDLIKETGKNLFNRREALSSPLISVNLAGKSFADVKQLHPWCIAWENTNPTCIKLVFEKPVNMSLLKLWLHGDYSSIEIRAEGKILGTANKQPNGEPEVDVDEVAIHLPDQTARELEVHFAKRSAPLYVAELELWGMEFGEIHEEDSIPENR